MVEFSGVTRWGLPLFLSISLSKLWNHSSWVYALLFQHFCWTFSDVSLLFYFNTLMKSLDYLMKSLDTLMKSLDTLMKSWDTLMKSLD